LFPYTFLSFLIVYRKINLSSARDGNPWRIIDDDTIISIEFIIIYIGFYENGSPALPYSRKNYLKYFIDLLDYQL